MPRFEPDQMDLWCFGWARTRSKILGLDLDKMLPRERLGKLSSTLGALLEEKVGAGERTQRIGLNGHPDQSWPEVYVGMSMDINVGFHKMCEQWRRVMDANYVWHAIPVKEKAFAMQLEAIEYWTILKALKVYLSGHLGIDHSTVIRSGYGRKRRVETTKSLEPASKPLPQRALSA